MSETPSAFTEPATVAMTNEAPPTIFLSDEVMLITAAANHFYAAHVGHPLSLAVAFGLLRRGGHAALASELLHRIDVNARNIYVSIMSLISRVFEANGLPPTALSMDQGEGLTGAAIEAAVTAEEQAGRVYEDYTPYLPFGHAAMMDMNILSAPNSGAEMVTMHMNGQRVPVFGPGNVKLIRWTAIFKAGRRTFEQVVINEGHGPLISYLHACILNLQTLVVRDDVVIHPELVAEIQTAIADVMSYRESLWALQPQIAATGGARFSLPGIPLASRPKGGNCIGGYLTIVWRYPA